MTLYDIDREILRVLDGAVDPETGEIMIDTDTLDALTMERDQKIENIGLYIKEVTAEVKAIAEEIESLTKRKKTAENKAKRLKDYLSYALNGEKFKTARLTVSYRASKSVNVADEGAFIEWAEKNAEDLLRYSAPQINKMELGNRLKAGEEIAGAELVENTSIIIK